MATGSVVSAEGSEVIPSALNLNSGAGLAQLSDILAGKVFVGSSGSPSKEDRILYGALKNLGAATLRSYPAVRSYFNTVAQFTEEARQSWQ